MDIDGILVEGLNVYYRLPDDIQYFKTDMEDDLLKDSIEKIVQEINEKIKFNETVRKSWFGYSFRDEEYFNPESLILNVLKNNK